MVCVAAVIAHPLERVAASAAWSRPMLVAVKGELQPLRTAVRAPHGRTPATAPRPRRVLVADELQPRRRGFGWWRGPRPCLGLGSDKGRRRSCCGARGADFLIHRRAPSSGRCEVNAGWTIVLPQLRRGTAGGGPGEAEGITSTSG
ncbi:unnamed protein product [Miscanthus lutarioriparius]|uniref:Uncharacterized protein n=1 Tax=Miscanthus lutarioriparius TaxID=422564 RepID=A0A811RZH3_9POAL|nr:unnamed protein product [Miscanthus lutarioriparius]